LVAYGTCARVCLSVIEEGRKEGLNVGLFRPITLFPFPDDGLREKLIGKKILVVEMSYGQMLEDVKLALGESSQIEFYGRAGGVWITPKEILEEIKKLYG
jgi:2-oxoglutarate ferredoxin oxidoreductase subunit alpha